MELRHLARTTYWQAAGRTEIIESKIAALEKEMAREAGKTESIPAIGTKIFRRKFIDGKEQIGEIEDTQVVKGYTGNSDGGPHWSERCETSPVGLVCPAIVCQSGKTIALDMYFFSWLPASTDTAPAAIATANPVLISTTCDKYARRMVRELNSTPDGFYVPGGFRCNRAKFQDGVLRCSVQGNGTHDILASDWEKGFTDAYGRTVCVTRKP